MRRGTHLEVQLFHASSDVLVSVCNHNAIAAWLRNAVADREECTVSDFQNWAPTAIASQPSFACWLVVGCTLQVASHADCLDASLWRGSGSSLYLPKRILPRLHVGSAVSAAVSCTG